MRAPVWLEAVPVAEGIMLRVVGAAATAFDAAFSLEVSAGTNHSLHRGHVALTPDETVILSTISIATGSGGGWKAVLHVDPSAGEAYQQVESSG